MLEVVLGGAILGLVRPPLLEPFGSQINETFIYTFMCLFVSRSLQGRVGSVGSGRIASVRSVQYRVGRSRFCYVPISQSLRLWSECPSLLLIPFPVMRALPRLMCMPGGPPNEGRMSKRRARP